MDARIDHLNRESHGQFGQRFSVPACDARSQAFLAIKRETQRRIVWIISAAEDLEAIGIVGDQSFGEPGAKRSPAPQQIDGLQE